MKLSVSNMKSWALLLMVTLAIFSNHECDASNSDQDGEDGSKSPSPTLSPSISHGPTVTVVVTGSPSTVPSTSHNPTISNQPTSYPSSSSSPSSSPSASSGNNASSSPSIKHEPTVSPSSVPSYFGTTTMKPTTKYTSEPAAPTAPTKSHGFLYYLSKIWYKLLAVFATLSGQVTRGCAALRQVEFLRKIGHVLGNTGSAIYRLSGMQKAVRAFRRWRSGRGSAMDDDGSTMMQGLLMRENE
eukprot:scaffold787_cov285-Chaetoceros_neogracile.AAC.61